MKLSDKTNKVLLDLVKKIEKETGKPAQLTLAQPTGDGMTKKVVGAFADRGPLTVKLTKDYQKWQTRERVPIPREWKPLDGSKHSSIAAIKTFIYKMKVTYLISNGIDLKKCPDDPKELVYKCPKCGSFGGEEKTVPGATTTIHRDGTETKKHLPHLETYKACWNYAPGSMWSLCQMCGAPNPSLGPFEELKVVGTDDNGYFLAIDGPNMGSAGGPTYIQVGRIIVPKLE